MTKEQIIKKILKYHWRPWLERPFNVFILSLSKGSHVREIMKKVGVDLEMEASVYERGNWYESEEVWENCAKQLKKFYAAGGSFVTISKLAESFYREKKQEISKMAKARGNDFVKLQKIEKILQIVYAYIWLTHCFEYLFTKILNEEVPKYVKGDAAKFIGDISISEKKNSQGLMIDAIIRGDNLKQIVKEYGWIKVRDVFSSPFSEAELKKEKKEIIKAYKNIKIDKKAVVPKELEKLVTDVRELVYFRTFRTDMLYEFCFLVRPILKRIAKHFGVKFEDLKDCCIYELLQGKFIKRRPIMFTYRDKIYFSDKPILSEDIIKNKEVKGQVAYQGIVHGRVKIIKKAHETNKVKEGDILVTQMTFPSYVLAMKRAAAFITDEGGITCHAAIIAREMKKPCIIGTKIATKVLHDGDFVEVDANKGVVKILKK
jgi:phosphohistidine swiveling domain-containing protein